MNSELSFIRYWIGKYFRGTRGGRGGVAVGADGNEKPRGAIAGQAYMQGRGSVTTRLLAALAIGAAGAAAAVLVSGCSSRDEFPAILADPFPRGDAPLSPEQVKQATDALISARDHLSAEAQASGVPNATASAAPPNPAPAKAPAAAAPVAAANAASGTTQTAGAGAKP